ncbi:unnamed protein product [Choristocarpus tenellus]
MGVTHALSLGITPEEAKLITPEQASIISELGKELLARGDVDKEVNFPMLLRYLVASQWRLEVGGKRVSEYIFETMRWREEKEVNNIVSSPSRFLVEASTGKLYVWGKCTKGRPIIWIHLQRANTWDHQIALDFLVYTVERVILSMGPDTFGIDNSDKFCVVVDCSFTERKQLPPVGLLREVASLLMKHYPSRLGALYLLNTGMIISLLWQGVSLLLRQQTRDKIVITSGSHEEQLETLKGYIGATQVEEGITKTTFDAESYLCGNIT